jgi:DNA-binding HxlR family transcriptional regulator
VNGTRTVNPPVGVGVCPFVRAVSMVQETWTFLILREAVTKGAATAEEFGRIPGLASWVLISRLDSLVGTGVFAVSPVDNGSPSYELTEAGMQLVVILRALGDWADRFSPGTMSAELAI